MINQGKFRDDLFYRLNVIAVDVPPLRDRSEDIVLLADHFLEKFNLEIGKHIYGFSDRAMRMLIQYSWPGNIRQLENAVEHAVVVSNDLEINVEDFPNYLAKNEIESKAKASVNDSYRSLDQLEKEHILNILQANNWNINKSARILGINRVTLYNKIKKYNLKLHGAA